MDIESWLGSIGLQRYAEAFRKNDIDIDVLPELTDAELKELGLSLGDRKRLLKAVTALADHGPVVASAAPLTAEQHREAERRHLTVMFVDLVSSTALAEQVDPEELRLILRAYYSIVAEAVARYEGRVAKYMGDGVLAYFGWPQAHEDEAERAVRAGLSTVEAVGGLSAPTGQQLVARVGIATGLVVVGDLIGEGSSQEESVVGDTPNLAARIQAIAAPGSVAIAEGTWRLLGDLFHFDDLGEHRLAGFARPVHIFRASDASRSSGRFDALRGRYLTPLIAREHELGLLLDRWQQAKSGDGQVVLLAGEPGIGKSRMLQSLRERIFGEPHTRLRYFCSPYHQNTAFHPILAQITHAAGFEPEDDPQAKLAKLKVLFARSGRPPEEPAILTASLLAVPIPDHQAPSGRGPQNLKARLQDMWCQQVVGLAEQRPVLMLLEDAHWIDPSSLEQFELIIDRIQDLAVLLVVTCRPEFQQPWGRYPHVTALFLNRLSARQSAAMVDRITGDKALPEEVLRQVVSKADGVPLFLEELTKAVLESGLLKDGGDRWCLDGPLPPLAIPATLHDSLMARLDRMAPVKEVAQVASVIGRDFSYDILAAAARMDHGKLDEALGQLAGAELVFRRSMPPNPVYAFKHALVQEAAYTSLLRRKRQQIHARLAEILQERFPDTPPEVIAHHLSEAGQIENSVDWWERAGHQAMSRATGKEAAAHFGRAVAQLNALPESDDRCRREISLQSALGGALVNAAGLASDALEHTYMKARDLCESIGDTRQQFTVEWGLWHVYVGRAQFRDARSLADRLVAWADAEHSLEFRLQACHADWTTLNFMGMYAAARSRCDQGWAFYDENQHGNHAFAYGGHDPGVCSRNQGALVTWCLGLPDQANACYAEGLALARRLEHPQILVHALTWGLPLFQLMRDDRCLREQSAAVIELAGQQELANYQCDARIMQGWALAAVDEPSEAVLLIRSALTERETFGTRFLRPYYLSLLALAQCRAGDTLAALASVDDALRTAQTTGEIWAEPELTRIKGELLLANGARDSEEPERCFRAALAQARERGAHGWGLRSAVSLARLYAEQNRRDEARDLLNPAVARFQEGCELPDLAEAHDLLNQLT